MVANALSNVHGRKLRIYHKGSLLRDMSAPLLDTFSTCTIRVCPRCGENHGDMRLRRLEQHGEKISHWAPCPKTGEPILAFKEVS